MIKCKTENVILNVIFLKLVLNLPDVSPITATKATKIIFIFYKI